MAPVLLKGQGLNFVLILVQAQGDPQQYMLAYEVICKVKCG